MKKRMSVILLESKRINLLGDICKFDYGLNISSKEDTGYPTHNLYIVSDEEIKEGDYAIYLTENKVFKIQEITDKGVLAQRWKKIIATTDTNLWLQGAKSASKGPIYNIAKIPESFIFLYIKAYNEEKQIKEVSVEYERTFACHDSALDARYWDKLKLTSQGEIIIHLVEERLYTIEEMRDASWQGYCFDYKLPHIGTKAFKNEKQKFDEWFDKNYPK